MKSKKGVYAIIATIIVIIAAILFGVNNSHKSSVASHKDVAKTSISSKKKAKHAKKKATKVSAKKQSSSASSATPQKNNNDTGADPKYGSLGYVNVPKEFIGTWYGGDYNSSDISTVTITAKTINGNPMFKQDENYRNKMNEENSDNSQVDPHTANWLAAVAGPASGNSDAYLSTVPWTGLISGSDNWRIHDENGMKILLWSHGGDNFVTSVYYKTPELAKKYAEHQFDDLNYM
ncbi:hypothetical protein [Lactobacillus psittaci]|uniref:DUF4767 domain-containing protein n=1 Tax=Lactobacillus psittaci DSM 15354 TaxID=1122152 RepID=A0A0R1RY48_9LACO|nr:hypothetical protein [Lactobacillus psittaci]KRL61920.1 hypothetical protein FC23_GL000418 [Lactobacillus psittaci DSM 15354]